MHWVLFDVADGLSHLLRNVLYQSHPLLAVSYTHLGNTDRVSLNAQQYMKSQKADGRITNYPTSDKRYNMGEVLVDQYLYNWLWTGDLSEMENGGYSFVTRYLEFIEAQMKVGDTNLYENWLNAWNTDNKWANGGASSIETAYVWSCLLYTSRCV